MGKRKRKKRNKLLIFAGELLVVGFVFFTVLLFASNIHRSMTGGDLLSSDTVDKEVPDSGQQDTSTDAEGEAESDEVAFTEKTTPEAEKDEQETQTESDADKPEEDPDKEEQEADKGELPTVDLNGIRSTSAILMRLDDGALVSELDADTRISPGAFTKLMTVLVALEKVTDMDDTVDINIYWYNDLYVKNVSMAGFFPGDNVSVQDMLYGALLASGSESCMGLALKYYESEEAFIAAMNQKAEELGMTNTHFTSLLGLYDANQYTTVRDLMTMLTYALQNEDFRTIYCAKSYTSSSTSAFPGGITFYNSVLSDIDHDAISNGEIIGGKAAYITSTGLCFTGLAKINDTEYLLVTAGADGSSSSDTGHLLDAVDIFNRISEG